MAVITESTLIKTKTIGKRTFIYLVLISLSILMILPFLWMAITSLKKMEEVFHVPMIIFSRNMGLFNYKDVIDKGVLIRLRNTFFIAFAATILRLFFCSLAGYGFAKFRFPGRNILFSVLIASMIVPFTTIIVPLYIMMVNFHWVNTFLPLIVPGAASAFGIFFMRQYIRCIPDDLLDAARIDGCSEFSIYVRVIFPIVTPGLVSLGLIFFMQSWNDFLWPLVILKSPENQTLPIMIATLTGLAGTTMYNLQMAVSVISITPLIIIFLIFQRRFTAGITFGAVKG
ncbi:sugar ABC transporter permease [Candidatus Atribacteria bacterium HGW-Atribacteria-1]|nr:MAG: sugar ABC transporter permease [Candidatus Atribacteria bacterium HGW-Atribacteria-1]